MTIKRPPCITRRRNRFRALAVLLGAASILTAGRWVAVTADADPPPPSRPIAYTPCAEVVLTWRPPGFVLAERRLHALARNHMGTVETYTGNNVSIRTYSGVNAIDALEDLELVGRPVQAGGRDFVLHDTAAYPGLLLAELSDVDSDEPCDSIAVRTFNLTEDVMVALLTGLDIHERAGPWGTADRWTE